MVNLRRTLLDNASLSGVERLLGVAKTGNLYNSYNDICCLEKLLQAILFSEELLAISDYKQFFQRRREQAFDYISFVPKTAFDYQGFSEAAAIFAKDTTCKDALALGH